MVGPKTNSSSEGSTTSSRTTSIASASVVSSPPSVKDVAEVPLSSPAGSTRTTLECFPSNDDELDADDDDGQGHSQTGSVLERSNSFDAMLKYVESGHEDFKENAHK